jgi:hypothetical protein
MATVSTSVTPSGLSEAEQRAQLRGALIAGTVEWYGLPALRHRDRTGVRQAVLFRPPRLCLASSAFGRFFIRFVGRPIGPGDLDLINHPRSRARHTPTTMVLASGIFSLPTRA